MIHTPSFCPSCSHGARIYEVEAHAARIMEKLGITNVASLTRYAIREGITSASS